MRDPVRSTGDLVVVMAWTALAAAAVFSGVGPGPLRTALALPVLLLFPGYALLSILFPRAGMSDAERAEADSVGLDGIERFALSVGTSVLLVPLTAFVLNFTPYGIHTRPIVLGVSGLVVGLAALGYLARIAQPVDERLFVPVFTWPFRLAGRYLRVPRRDLKSNTPFVPSGEGTRFLNVLFAVSLLTLAVTAGYAATNPPANNDPFSEFYLLTQDGDGEFTSEGIPHELSSGSTTTIYTAIGNEEGQTVPYTVVVLLDGQELSRQSTKVAEGETKRLAHEVQPGQTGDRLKLSFLLYRGQVPDDPSPENAYIETHLWVSVN